MSNESENKRIDLTQFEMLENGEYRIEGCIADTTRYMYEDESDIRLSKQMNLLPNLITELKRSYKEIDSLTATLTGWQGDVPYVEDCEDCGAHDGAQTEGCDSCGIIHYQTSKGLRDLYGYTWGFFHKDSPKWTEFQ